MPLSTIQGQSCFPFGQIRPSVRFDIHQIHYPCPFTAGLSDLHGQLGPTKAINCPTSALTQQCCTCLPGMLLGVYSRAYPSASNNCVVPHLPLHRSGCSPSLICCRRVRCQGAFCEPPVPLLSPKYISPHLCWSRSGADYPHVDQVVPSWL